MKRTKRTINIHIFSVYTKTTCCIFNTNKKQKRNSAPKHLAHGFVTTVIRILMMNISIMFVMFKVRKTMAVPKCKRSSESRPSSGVVLRRGNGLAPTGGDGAVGSRTDGSFGLAGRCGSAYCPLDAPLCSPHTLPCSVLASRCCLFCSYTMAALIH